MSGVAAPSVALLVVSYGSHELVADNLTRTELPADAVVVIVDNFTTIAERSAITELCEQRGWHLVAPATNLGFGSGMNAAAERAESLGARAFVLLNPDAHMLDDGVGRLHELVRSDELVLAAPLVVRPDGSHFSSEMELDLDTGSVRRRVADRRFEHSAMWVSGACLAVSSRLWRMVGGFDDDYFLYWEDIDLSVRVEQAGGRIVVDPGIRAVHSPGGTQGSDASSRGKSEVYYFYNTRNRLVFAAKHLDRARRRGWRRRSVRAGWDILLRGGRRQLLHPGRTIVPAISGTLDGAGFLRRSERLARGSRGGTAATDSQGDHPVAPSNTEGNPHVADQ